MVWCHVWLLVVAAALNCGAWQAIAAENEKPADRVYVTSTHLLADSAGRWAEFSGEVRAEQGTTVILAERLKVFYASSEKAQSSAGADAKQAMGGGSIERIEANGQVKIIFDQRLAEADKAVYTTADRILVLTGQPARLTEGENTVSGGRIVFERNKNQITVEKPDKGRVEAVFFTKDQGLQ